MNTKITNRTSPLVFALLTLILFGATIGTAAPGDLDPTFSGDGKLTDWSGWATSVVIQPDGKIVVAGVSGGSYGVARYNSDGSIDATFGNSNGKVTAGTVGTGGLDASVAVQPDGKTVVAGIAYVGDIFDMALEVFRYNSDGTPDTAFGDSGQVILFPATGGDWSAAAWIHIQPDGKIIVGGGDRIFRLNPTGSLDGVANAPFYAYASAIQPNGKIMIAGPRWNAPNLDLGVARYNADGTLDTTFGSGGVVLTPIGSIQSNDLAIQTDGKIVVASGDRLIRYNENGSLDVGFGTGGVATPPMGSNPLCQSFSPCVGYDLAIQTDGKLVVTGNSNNDFAIVRYNMNGSLDTTFGSGDGISTVDFNNSNDTTFAVTLDSQRRAVIVGRSGGDFAIARFLLAPPSTPFDFDGDGRSDISVFRPSERTWYLNQSTNGFFATQFGLASDKLAPADYDGDGKTDIAVFRDGTWYWLASSSNNSFNAVQFGLPDDIPVPADFTGDGRAELAVYRGGAWWTLDLTNDQTQVVNFGLAADNPVPADFDGDGRADQAVYRNGEEKGNKNAEWHLNRSTQGYAVVNWGLATDKPVPADYDGDGKTDLAVYRDGTWYLLQSSNGFAAFQWGISTDIPAPADYDGDGRTDAAVYRDGVWYLLQSSNGVSFHYFGLANDVPVPAAYLP